MEKFPLCALLLALGAFVQINTALTRDSKCLSTGFPPKAGRCPHLFLVKPSKEECVCDEDCPGDHKCCDFGHGSACAPPSFTKMGACPPLADGVIGPCAEFCSFDSDCLNDDKCCSNGCGHECTAPSKVKPGRCPLPGRTSLCVEYCFHDSQCPGKQKCCRTACGHACSEPW